MKIDFSCPVELINIRYHNGECRFHIRSFSEFVLQNMELEMAWLDAQGEVLVYQTKVLEGMSILYKEVAEEIVHVDDNLLAEFEIPLEEVADVELEVLSLHFDGGATWRAGLLNGFDYELEPLEGEKLHALRLIAGEDAITYPNEQGEVWVCVCGRANRFDDQFCIRCDRVKDDIMQTITPENAKAALQEQEERKIEENKKVLLEGERLKERQKEREQFLNRRKIFRLRLMIAGALLLVLLILGYLFGFPYYNSLEVDKLIEAGSYNEALQALQKLPESYNVEARSLALRYAMAKAKCEEKTLTSLAEAREIFTALGNYQDSADYIIKIDYEMAELLFANGQYEQALELYTSITSYADSALKIKEVRYQLALAMLERKEFDEAKAAFTELGNFKDSAEKIIECDYNLGLDAQDSEEYERAKDYFDSTRAYEYLDSETRYYEILNILASQSYAQRDFDTAGEYYLELSQSKNAATNYPDALSKARILLYQVGKIAMTQRDYDSAADIFGKIKDYLDAYTLYMDARLVLADRALTNGDNELALEILTEFEGQQAAAGAINRAKYQKAELLEQDGKLEEAAALYAEILKYSDAQTRYNSTQYKIAEAALASGDYDKAIEIFRLLGRYSDSAARVSESQYVKAQAALEEGNYAEAVELFVALGDYSDAESQLQTAVLARAKELIASSNYAEAETMLAGIANQSGIEDLLDETRYLIATAYIEQMEYQKALQLLELIGDYKDVATLRQQMRFSLAEQLENEGQTMQAAELYASLGDYKDAALRASRLFDEVYESIALLARASNSAGNLQEVFDALKDSNLSNLPGKYADLLPMFQNAAYRLGNEAYENKNAALAYSYYQKIREYLDVEKRLEAWSYRILGSWITSNGDKAVFREDGTANINGVEHAVFFVDGYQLHLGDTLESLKLAYYMNNRGNTAFTLRESSGQRRNFHYTRTIETQDTGNTETGAEESPTPSNTVVPIVIPNP